MAACADSPLAEGENSETGSLSDPLELELVAGGIGGPGNVDGVGAAARFNYPTGVVVDGAGNLYVADGFNHTIRKITAAGVVTTLAGAAGTSGSADGTGAAARFYIPADVAVDSAGNLYVADINNHTIRKITAAGVVTTLAGAAGIPGTANGVGAAARFDRPAGVAIDSAGNLYVADSNNHTIRKITAAGVVTTLAGFPLVEGSADGTGAAASFYLPDDVALDSAGNLYVADMGNNTIRKITAAGVVTTLAGAAGIEGSADGTGSAARFYRPTGMTIDSAGNLYVTDHNNHTIRKVTTAGVVTTLAGALTVGSTDGTGAAARFRRPRHVTVDSAGNVYVADQDNHTIRKITAAGVVTTLAGTAGTPGSTNGTGAAARFAFPAGVAAGSAGTLYVADGNHTIRKVTAAGAVTTLAGTAGTAGSTNGTGAAARFYLPSGMAVDSAGNLYVADSGNATIRKVTAAGVVTTLAGAGGFVGSADGTGAAARFNYPTGVAVDSAGNIYVADSNNHTIRKVTAAGVVTTLAGAAGMAGSTDGTGAAARFYRPTGVAVDSAGNVYVTDEGNATLRRVTASGTTTTIAGMTGMRGIDLGAAPRFSSPRSLAITGDSIVIADSDAILLLRHGAP